MNYGIRISAVQKHLSDNNIDNLLVTNPYNIYYLTGFKGHSETEREVTCLIDESTLTLFSPKLYQHEVNSLSNENGFQMVIVNERNDLFAKPAESVMRSTLGIEISDLRVVELYELLIYSDIDIKETDNIIENIREVKTSEELALVKIAVKITDDAFMLIKKEIKSGLTEKEISKRMIEIMEGLGADGPAFEPIVAYGSNSALPHYVTGNSKIRHGILLIDAGARYQGYNADLTRTFFLGKPEEKFVKTYKLLLKAQIKSIQMIKSGIKAEYPWKMTVNNFANHAKYFIHGLGHGIGLEVHEAPYLRRGINQILKEGMTVTVEPGLYYQKWGGIRIEDYCLITDAGCDVLSKMPKNMIDIVI